MRITYLGEELRTLAEAPDARSARLSPELVRAYRKAVDKIAKADDINTLSALRGLRLERLKGKRAGEWSVRINRQWRLILDFPQGDHARIHKIEDYH